MPRLANPIPDNAPRVDLNHPMVMPEPNSGCWLWIGHTVNGYGVLKRLPSKRGPGFNLRAHRVSYVQTNGDLPAHIVVDHLCFNRACVNPDHLDAVTSQTNTIRSKHLYSKTHCIRGHSLSSENVRLTKRGRRDCRACRKIHNSNRRRSKRHAQ